MQKRRSERWKSRQKHSGLFLLIYIVVCIFIFFLVWKITGYTSGLNAAKRYKAELLSAAEVPETKETEEERGIWDFTEEAQEDIEETEEVPRGIDFESLKAINPNVCAWLTIPGTEVSEAVVKGRDNEEYLHKLFDGTENASGTLFVDCRNAADFSDDVTMIYGHNMKDGSMFGSLSSYCDEAYLKGHERILLYLPEGTHVLTVISATVTTCDDAVFDLELPPSDSGKKRVLLSTCAYDYPDARLVLITEMD